MFVAIGVGAYGVGDLPPLHARLLQGLPVPRRRQRDPCDGRRAGRAQDGRARAQDSDHVRHLRDRHGGHRRHSAARGILLEGRDPVVRAREHQRRLDRALRGGIADGAADRVLHVPPPVAHVLRRAAHGRSDRASRARVAGVDDGRPRGARDRLRGRRLRRDPALPRADVPAAGAARRRSEHFESAGRLRYRSPSRLPASPVPGTSSAATRTARMPCGRRFARPASRAHEQVLRRRAVRRAARAAAALDLAAHLPGLRRPHPARRHAARPGRPRAADGGRARPRANRATCSSTCFFALAGLVVSLWWSWRHV